ncbi:NYN domain-containing protein [Clostridium bornimense]|uniref:NYN domain-containing protein n=1 Tax=Clostridium bornimense TaxID=1216932 RepID=UPI001C10A3CB|nr:NYN domain-containing protein [Clostridium bornimense]MBU5317583.1 NYN domain-containing protein [Clostridium bornimense]
MRYIFIDGYNIINSWSDLAIGENETLENSRQRLIEILENYVAMREDKLYLVFDAHLSKGSIEKEEKTNNITVVFTKEGETADSYIERKVNLIGRKKEVIVVTSDNLEQQTIFQRGATRMSSLEFNNEVKKSQNSLREEINKMNSKTRTTLVDRIEDEEVRKKLERIRRNLL